MSNVKTLSVGHLNSPTYVVVERPSHEGNTPYKRHTGSLSPPLAGTRGYPYPQDPTRSAYPHTTTIHIPVYGAHTQIFSDSHYPVERQADYPLDRFRENEQIVQHVRRRPSLLPIVADYGTSTDCSDRERYIETYRFPYERDMGLPPTALSSSGLIHPASRSGTTNVGTIHTPMELDHLHHSKRPRLCVEPKAPLHQPLVIDTRDMVEVKKEPAYTPQVEAISPTLPTDDLQQDLSPHRSSKDELLQAINRIDREINQVETQTTKLKKRKQELEAEANKPPDTKQVIQEISTSEPKQMSIAQIIYSENRKKAQQAHALLEKLGPKVDLPMYNQPMDTQIHHENRRKFMIFKKSLIQYFKRKYQERQIRENYLTETYSQFMQVWLKKIEKKENNANRRAKEAKVREFFEKQFPELKKQREDKERFSRVGQRIRSDAELEEIMDGLQEQEMEDKKMRSYAVIPPILLDSKQQRLQFINKNGLVEDPMAEYKERQMLNIWTDQEKEIFREKYLQHSKNFGLIATYLERKSVADCVQYYYLTKKSENYKQMLRKHNVRKRTRTLVKPQSQAHHNQTGITTRQQEEAKPTSTIITTTITTTTVTTTLSSSSSAIESISTSSNDVNVTNLSTTITCISSNGNVNSENMKNQNDSTSNSKIEIRDNIENGETTGDDTSKSKAPEQEKDKGNEGGDELSDDNELTNDHTGESGGVHPCAVCKIELENFGQSRPLTKSNCDQYGIKENELTAETRVCSSCRFKSVRRRYKQCPIPTCKTPKRKVKRLRPLPSKWSEVTIDVKESIIAELQIPAEVNKCCSACFNRIARKLGTHSIPDENTETSRWTEEEMEIAKRGLQEHGTDWKSISDMVQTKTKEQCKNFYFNYKRKLGLEDIIREYREIHGKDNSFSTITDDESGETTSSCEENCVDNCTSDTASAPSPDNKMLDEISEKDCSRQNLPNLTHKEQVSEPTDGPRLESCHSPRNVADYDSSATVSADEGQGLNENDGSTTSTQIASSETSRPQSGNGNDNANLIPNSGNSCISFSAQPKERLDGPAMHESSNNIPLVKTLLQDPVIGTIPHEIITSHHSSRNQPFLPSPQDGKPPKEEPTCVRDLIYQAIEMSLQWPVKPGKSTTPVTTTSTLQSIVNREREKDVFSRDSSQELKEEINEHVNLSHTPPAAHKASRPHYSVTRPEGLMAQYAHHINRDPDMEILDYEVQDLSRKDKTQDKNYSPPREFVGLKRERVVTTVRPPSEVGYSTSHQFPPYGNIHPPPAHSNYSRSNRLLPPPDLSPQYTTEPREVYYPRSSDSHGKTSYVSEQLHSQPPQLIAQPPTPITPATPPPSRILPKSAKCNVPPPPPLITSSVKSAPLSPKIPYKDKLISHPPSGSITQGTPVNQHLSSTSNNANLSQSVSRHDNFLGHPSAHLPKEAGSITLGTPLPHDSNSKRGISSSGRMESSVSASSTPAYDSNSRNPVTVSEGLPRPGLRVMYDPSAIEQYYRRMSPTGPYSYTPAFSSYPSSQQTSRTAYHSESQLSSKQIMIDFNTSKQMQMRRGSNSEKEARISPRAHESNQHPPLSSSSTPDPRMFSVYTNVPYPSNTTGVPFPGQGPVYFPVGDSRFHHHSGSPIVQIDRPHSPGNESQISPNTSWPSPVSKQSSVHSPGLQQSHVTPRQNVIQRSITWGTAKPSVIQTPTSASPRSVDIRTESISPVPSMRKGAPSPRHPPPGTYSINPSSHDAFNTLVNAAVAQPSLVVPKEEKQSPVVSSPNMHIHSEITRSPRERSAVEGLEKSLLDMHKRPRSFSESGQSIITNNSREKYKNEREHGRAAVEGLSVDGERERIIVTHSNMREDQHYLVETGPNTDYSQNNLERLTVDMERTKMGITEQTTSSLRLSNAREPFTREQFEKQMRQPNYNMSRSGRERSISQSRKHDENRQKFVRMEMAERPTTSTPYSHQNELDNEASRIFSQSFQKDHQKPSSTQRGFTAANLIDAIITHQINQTTENPTNNKNAVIDNIFQRQQSENDKRSYELPELPPEQPPGNLIDLILTHEIDQNTENPTNSSRQEVVTIDDETPLNRERYNRERPGSHNHSSPIQDSFTMVTDKNFKTLGDRIAAIIYKDYHSSKASYSQPSAQPSYNHSRIAARSSTISALSPASSNRTNYQPEMCHVLDTHHHNRPLEGIAASLPAEGLTGPQSSPISEPDHSLQNCSGSTCGSHSWKLRRALQQDRDREHQSPGCADTSSISHQSTQVASNVMNQDERQIIRVAQSGSPCIQSSHSSRSSHTSPVTPYAVEPISPPNQPSSDNIISNNSRVISTSTTTGDMNSFSGQHPSNRTSAWVTNPGITGLLTTRRLYQHESSEPSVSVSSSVVHSSNIPTCIGNLGPSISNRPPHQQQIGLSPLDYVKNRIVEVMRTATDENTEIHETVRKGIPSSSQSGQKEEKDETQNIRYNSLNNYDSECPSENIRETMTPQSTQRYSPAVTPVSFIPTPPRPSSAVDTNLNRVSVMADSSHLYKHNLECVPHNSDWKDVRTSKIRPRSASPSSSDITTKELEETSRKKSRLESHYIPESSTEKNNLPLPESSENAHSSTVSGHLEPPQLTSFGDQSENNNYISESRSTPPISSNGNNLSRSASPSELLCSQSSRREGERSTVESSTYCESKGENQWEVTSGVGDDRTTTDCISHIVDSPASGEMVIDESSNINSASSSQIEPVSPPTQEAISTSGNIETREQVGSSSNSTNSAQVGSSNGISLADPSQSGPVTSTQGQNSRANTPLSSGVIGPGCYSPYSSSVSSTSISSSSPIYSSSSITPSVSSSQHIPYSNFSRNTPYPYAYSALSVRSLTASSHQCSSPSSTQNPNSSLSCATSHIQSSAVSESSSSSNSPSSLSRENQPAPILSSQYEPLSDED